MSIDPSLFERGFRQDWENTRYIKSGRIWSMDIFSMISAGALALLRPSLPSFMWLSSLIGFLISRRLRAELDECLGSLQALAAQAVVAEFVVLVLRLQNCKEAKGIREQAGRVPVNAARKTTPAQDA